MKRYLLLTLFVTLLLTGCEKNSAESVTASLQEQIQNTDFIWQETSSPLEQQAFPYQDFTETYGVLKDWHAASNQDAVFLYVQEHTYTVLFFDDEKKEYSTLPIQLEDLPEDVHGTWEAIRLSPWGSIFLFDSQRAYGYQPGESLSYVDFPADWEGGIVFPGENQMVCKTNLYSEYLLFDTLSGKKTDTYLDEAFLYQPVSNNNTLLWQEDNTLLLVTGNGLYENGNGQWNLIIPAERTSMYLPDFKPLTLQKKEENQYIITDFAAEYHYTQIPAGKEEPVTITVFSLMEIGLIKEAVVRYQIEHPGIIIDYQFAAQTLPASAQDMNALIGKVNTKILSQSPADLYILDDLPWEYYQEKGCFLDLSEMVQPFTDNENYYSSVLTGTRTKEGLFTVPLFFRGDFIICREELSPYVESLHDLAAFLEANPKTPGLVPFYYLDNSKGYYLPMLYHYYQQDLGTEASLTEESIKEFLQSAKIIYDRMKQNPNVEKASFKEAYRQGTPIIVTDELYLLMGLRDGDMIFYTCNGVLTTYLSQGFHFPGYELVPTGRYHPELLTGIHAKSPHQEEAADFLSYLLGYIEKTGSKTGMLQLGIPVYQPATSALIDHQRTAVLSRYDVTDNYFFRPDYGEGFPIFVPTTEDEKEIIRLLSDYDTPVLYANPLTNPVYAFMDERIDGFFEGEKSLEDTAHDIYSGILLMENEG